MQRSMLQNRTKTMPSNEQKKPSDWKKANSQTHTHNHVSMHYHLTYSSISERGIKARPNHISLVRRLPSSSSFLRFGLFLFPPTLRVISRDCCFFYLLFIFDRLITALFGLTESARMGPACGSHINLTSFLHFFHFAMIAMRDSRFWINY